MCRIAVQAPVVPATSGPARSKEKRSAWLCPRNSMNGCGRLLLSGANSRPRSRKCNVSAAKFCLKPCPTLHAVNDWARKFLVLCKRHSPFRARCVLGFVTQGGVAALLALGYFLSPLWGCGFRSAAFRPLHRDRGSRRANSLSAIGIRALKRRERRAPLLMLRTHA